MVTGRSEFTPLAPCVSALAALLRHLALGLVGLMSLVVGAAAAEQALGLDEIRELLVGNTVHGVGHESGWFFAIYYRPDGVAIGRSSFVKDVEPVYYEDGRWEITPESGYCLQWKTWKAGRKRCMNMFRHGDGYEFRTHDGRRQSIVEVLTGNPGKM